MAQKSAKISDVTEPGKVAPGATSRPIVVTSHPAMASDPMMVHSAAPEQEPEKAEPVSRTAKTISPLQPMVVPEDEASKDDAVSDKATPDESEAAEKPAEPDDAEVAEAPADTTPEPTRRDVEAESQAAETEAATAEATRQQELEGMIAAGTYAVPINAVGRKRSHMYIVLLAVFSVVLTLVLVDAALDGGLIHLSGLPHTNFF